MDRLPRWRGGKASALISQALPTSAPSDDRVEKPRSLLADLLDFSLKSRAQRGQRLSQSVVNAAGDFSLLMFLGQARRCEAGFLVPVRVNFFALGQRHS